MHIYWTSVVLIALLLLLALLSVLQKDAYPESFNMPLGAAGMGLVFMAFDLLQLAGLPPLHWGWEGAFALTFILWLLGALRSNRLYQ